MNSVFGVAGMPVVEMEKFNNSIKDLFGGETEVFGSDDGVLNVGRFLTNDKMNGFASASGVHVFLHGFLQKPVPDWKHSSEPIDDPSLVAKYLLDRYLSKGDDFLDNIFGNFSVILLDLNKKRLVLASDSYSHCNLFYHSFEETGELLFSTNLFSLGLALGDKLEIDRSLEDFFLIYGFFPWNRTMYKGVEYLPAEKMLIWQNGKCEYKDIKYDVVFNKDLSFMKKEDFSEDFVVDKLYEVFMNSLKVTLTSEKRVAVLLGGFDSSLVAAGLKRLGKEVETFSFYYEDERFNQPHTDTLSNFLGTKHHWVKIDAGTITNGLKNYHKIFNKPTKWPNYVIQTQRLAEVIKEKGFNYCYSGDACDYVFFGYPITYEKIKLMQKLGKWPNWLVKSLLALSQWGIADRRLGRPYHVGLGILRALGRPMPERGFLNMRAFDDYCLKHIRKDAPPLQERNVEGVLSDLARPHAGLHPIRLGYIGKHYIAPYKIKINGSADTTGLIINSPFTYREMLELAGLLPEEYIRPDASKDKKYIGKYILAKMAEDKKMLPREVIYQNKVGAVDAPIADWYAGEMKDFVIDLMKGLPFDYNEKYIKDLIRPKWSERAWEKLISKNTSNIVSISLGASLLATYASYTSLAKIAKSEDLQRSSG